MYIHICKTAYHRYIYICIHTYIYVNNIYMKPTCTCLWTWDNAKTGALGRPKPRFWVPKRSLGARFRINNYRNKQKTTMNPNTNANTNTTNTNTNTNSNTSTDTNTTSNDNDKDKDKDNDNQGRAIHGVYALAIIPKVEGNYEFC